jgi:hypothetical protein
VGWGEAKSILLPLLTGIVFLAVLAPYLLMSHRLTGHYFYNVNSTFYLWYDDWEEALAGTKAHGDRVGWPVMPASEIPSPAKYIREHTVAQATERVVNGAHEVMNNVLRSYGYLNYLLLYGALLIVVGVIRRRHTLRLISENAVPLLFILGYFGVFLLLYFWYAPIVAGDRLILALFIPLLLAFSSGLHSLLGGAEIRVRGQSISWLTALNVVILLWVAANTVWALGRGVYVLSGAG